MLTHLLRFYLYLAANHSFIFILLQITNCISISLPTTNFIIILLPIILSLSCFQSLVLSLSCFQLQIENHQFCATFYPVHQKNLLSTITNFTKNQQSAICRHISTGEPTITEVFAFLWREKTMTRQRKCWNCHVKEFSWTFLDKPVSLAPTHVSPLVRWLVGPPVILLNFHCPWTFLCNSRL